MVKAGQHLRVCRCLRMAGLGVAMWMTVCVPMACMTPEKAVRQTDETGTRLATAYWQDQTGSTNAFDVHRPSDALTLRIALLAVSRGEQNVVFPRVPDTVFRPASDGTLTLSLTDVMCVAARNDRAYQKLKEAIFSAALDLDYQQYLFEATFSGMLLGVLSGSPDAEKIAGTGAAGVQRQLMNGADIAGQLAVDVASLLHDDWRSVGLTGDLTMSVPLMRGAGREIVREPLTQAERNLMYAIRTFERYRQTFAVSVASTYYDAIEYAQRVKNAEDNEKNLAENSRRAEMWFAAGRMQRIQVDQARSDLLSASGTVVSTRRSYEAYLDALKIKIGLPPESRVLPDFTDLQRLEQQMERLARANASAVSDYPDEAEACRIALNERQDLFVARCGVEDDARAVKIAADALRADVTLTGKASLDRARATGDGGFDGDEAWSAGLRADLPWNRRKERNAFRKRLIALEQSKRDLEEQEDAVKQAVRNGLRNLVAARASYEIQVEALKVANLRVESNRLFLLSGRSSMRDVLEAQASLLTARNALYSALIDWQLGDLQLRRDMGVLKISESGMWVVPFGDHHG